MPVVHPFKADPNSATFTFFYQSSFAQDRSTPPSVESRSTTGPRTFAFVAKPKAAAVPARR